MTGGAIGSLFAQLFELTDMERKTLLVAGACAGMTAVFGTPIAAILLAVELLLFELKPRSFLPVAVACITAAVERQYILPQAPLFPYIGGDVVDPLHALGWVGLGLAAGFGSALLTLLVYAVEDGFLKLPIIGSWWPFSGAIIQHRWAGRSAGARRRLPRHCKNAGGWTARRLRVAIDGRKGHHLVSRTLGSGTSGGVLAPLLIIGAGLGAVLSPYLPSSDPGFWATPKHVRHDGWHDARTVDRKLVRC